MGLLLGLAPPGLAVSESSSRSLPVHGGMKLLSRPCRLRIRVTYRIRYDGCEAIPHYFNS